jgi:uncharacterized protein DUF3887
MRKALLGFFVLFVLSACSPGKDVPIAEAGVVDFHQKLNNGDFDTITNEASAEFKAATKQDDFIKLLSVIHRKLGNFQSSKSTGWNDTVATGGTTVTLNYSATYENGTADENFVFRITDGKAVLLGYHINSMALILN